MDLAQALAGVDEHPWARTSHAYGSAEDLPAVLHALAGPDEEAAREAVTELYGSVLHQGTVYAASAEIAPFLARLAAAGCRAADLLALLGGMAGSRDVHGVPPEAVRSAVAAQLPLILPLLAAPDAEVRQAAAWAASHTGAAEAVLPELRARRTHEQVPVVRAELLGALSRLDPAGAVPAAREALAAPRDQPGPVVVAAAFAWLDAGLPWGDAQQAALVGLLPLGPHVAGRLDLDRHEPLNAVAEALLLRDTEQDRAAAGSLLAAALADPRPEVREEALWAADHACRLSRTAAPRILPALLSVLPGAAPKEAARALSLLERLGEAAAQATDVLAALAAREPAGAVPSPSAAAPAGTGPADGGTGRVDAAPDDQDEIAEHALAALVRVAPDRAAPLLARRLRGRPLDAAGGYFADEERPVPFEPGLLAAVRGRLREAAAAPVAPAVPLAAQVARSGRVEGPRAAELCRIVRMWGAQGLPALAELLAVLPRTTHAAAAAIGAVAPAGTPEERAAAAAALREVAGSSLAAAQALYELTGDSGPLTQYVAARLTGQPRDVAEAAAAAASLGRAGAGLAPAMRAALSGPGAKETTPVLDADTALARALWLVDGDADTAVRVLDSVLARALSMRWAQWQAVRAARAAALLGPAGRPLVPRLLRLLEIPEAAPDAVLALTAVAEPGSLDTAALADRALDAAEHGLNALEACDALLAVGPAALDPVRRRRLAALAERDLRVVDHGVETVIVRADERLRARARTVLAALTTGQPPAA